MGLGPGDVLMTFQKRGRPVTLDPRSMAVQLRDTEEDGR